MRNLPSPSPSVPQGSVLRKLASVSAEEAAAKRAAALRVRDAFVWRPPAAAPAGAPSAADYLLGELCMVARAAARNATWPPPMAGGGVVGRCMM